MNNNQTIEQKLEQLRKEWVAHPERRDAIKLAAGCLQNALRARQAKELTLETTEAPTATLPPFRHV